MCRLRIPKENGVMYILTLSDKIVIKEVFEHDEEEDGDDEEEEKEEDNNNDDDDDCLIMQNDDAGLSVVGLLG